MILEPIIVLFLLRYLRNILKRFSPNPRWEKHLLIAMFVTVPLAGLDIAFLSTEKTLFFWYLVQFCIIALAFKVPQLTPARTLLLGAVPLLVLFFIDDFTEIFFKSINSEIDTYINLGYAVAITWLVAMIVISNKQTKALKKERSERLAEEEKHRIMEAQKIELEEEVAKRTAELTQQKEELHNTLVELQSTQKQLIHSEKMASLGELTAGIAHEIQNPLNFVNNFSEISAELVAELKEALTAKNQNGVEHLLKDIETNLQKINHHGKRADAIVKGMLQHSRANTGKKESTDINALVDEYLRLSYHGLRAKDKSFNATLIKDFDETIGNINVVPQDIGRVILNLITNAFYAVTEKKKQNRPEQVEDYEPTVTVSTKKFGDRVEVMVRDNGNGIPLHVVDKIFQPFFTTKPAGQGTGLGLSLSYDIIKAHGGEIKVETTEGEGTTFKINLPVN